MFSIAAGKFSIDEEEEMLSVEVVGAGDDVNEENEAANLGTGWTCGKKVEVLLLFRLWVDVVAALLVCICAFIWNMCLSDLKINDKN